MNAAAARHTRILLGEGAVKVPMDVPLPDGFSRVWEGPVRLGDLHLSGLAIQDGGRVEWVRLDFAAILKHTPEDAADDFDPYGVAYGYLCLIREAPADVGRPCPLCGAHGVFEGGATCEVCDVPPEAFDPPPEYGGESGAEGG